MKGWPSVYAVGFESRALYVRDVLRGNDISAEILVKKDSLYGFGYLEVHVPSDQVILALKIIEEEINFG